MAARYDSVMIKDQQAYARHTEQEDLAVLRGMTAEDSIAIGEALLTSDLMRLAQLPDDDQPRNLAIAMGLRSTAAEDALSPSRPRDGESDARGGG